MNQTLTSAPVEYMQRMRDYYLALGYNNPYQWAYHESVPFHALKKSVTQSRIGLVTTAAPLKSGAGIKAREHRITLQPSSIRSIPVMPRAMTSSAFPTSAMTVTTPPLMTLAATFHSKHCAARRPMDMSVSCHHASTAYPPTAAKPPRSIKTAPICWLCCKRTKSI